MNKSFEQHERAWEAQQDQKMDAYFDAQDMEKEKGTRNNEEDYDPPYDEPYNANDKSNAWMDYIA